MTAVHDLAGAAGLQIDWVDATNHPQRVDDEALRQVLDALGYAADDDAAIARSLAMAADEHATIGFVSVDAGEAAALPDSIGEPGAGELLLEDGRVFPIVVERDARGLRLPPVEAIGYHRLRLKGRELMVAVAPSRCLGIGDVASGRRVWGPAVQVPSLRDHRALDFGDFRTLAHAARSFAAKGADVLAISPTHALYPADPQRFSPYAPSSRLFHNVLFGDPGVIGHQVAALTSDDDPLIDYARAIPARMAALRSAFVARGESLAAPLAAFRAKDGGELERHATYDALHAHFFAEGADGWQGWPTAYHDPAGAAVAQFAAEHRADVDFYVFAQWLAETSLDAAQAAARDAGMAVGLIADLAVGMDAGGSHAWSRRDELLTGLSIGAPPDLLGPEGQNWGITGFSPMALRRTGFDAFIATLRAAVEHAGGIRIDHALGLRRLWVVPDGGTSAEGAYLGMPQDDMLRILAIESHKAQAVVIGEDLGTIPEGLRPALEARQVLGMRVLWFEREHDGGFLPPTHWPQQAAAMTGTHDLATVAGWWRGRDLEWNEQLGRGGDIARARDDREWDRGRLWYAFTRSGAAQGERPAAENETPVVDAALAHVGSTPCDIAILPMEDVLGLVEQPNLPGTIDEHPNWRRRMPGATADLLDEPATAARLVRLNETRKA